MVTAGMVRSMMNYNSFIQHLPVDYFNWSHADQLAFQVRTFLPTAVNWIEGWAGASMQNLVRVHFVLFDELRTQPQFVFRHTWRLGDLLMWDNLATMHRATEFEDTKYRRDMRRATCRERPVELVAAA